MLPENFKLMNGMLLARGRAKEWHDLKNGAVVENAIVS